MEHYEINLSHISEISMLQVSTIPVVCRCLVPLFKRADLDIGSSTKSNRDEWGHVQYHGNYCPSAAFELILQWLVATGSIVTELVRMRLKSIFFTP